MRACASLRNKSNAASCLNRQTIALWAIMKTSIKVVILHSGHSVLQGWGLDIVANGSDQIMTEATQGFREAVL